MNGKKYVKRYRRMVKSSVPQDYPDRKRILRDMQMALDDFLEEHPQADYETLEKEFGKPEELAASLIDGLSGEQVLRLFMQRKKWEIVTVVAAGILAFAVTAILISLAEKNRAVEITEELVIYEEQPAEEGSGEGAVKE